MKDSPIKIIKSRESVAPQRKESHGAIITWRGKRYWAEKNDMSWQTVLPWSWSLSVSPITTLSFYHWTTYSLLSVPAHSCFCKCCFSLPGMSGRLSFLPLYRSSRNTFFSESSLMTSSSQGKYLLFCTTITYSTYQHYYVLSHPML